MTEFDAASFRDPAGRVFRANDRVFRTIDPDGAKDLDALFASGLLASQAAAGRLVATWRHRAEEAGLDPDEVGAEILEHEAIAVVTYPYEWAFSMLRDAALVTLDLQIAALAKGFVLKDATPFNVQFLRGRAVWIDVPSLVPYEPGRPWTAYAQFCRTFLFPLMLAAYRGADFRAILRGSIDGIDPAAADALLGGWWNAATKKGVLAHVVVQASLDRKFRGADLPTAGGRGAFTRATLEALARGLRGVVEALRTEDASHWTDYDETRDRAEREWKETFVREALVHGPAPRSAIDLGANTGRYARLAAERAERVTAIDADAAAIDRLYNAERNRKDPPSRITCLAMNLLDPSPAQGWDLRERAAWTDRVRGDFVLALALVHHVCVTGNVPLEAFADLLARLAPRGVVEFVGPKDPLAARLLAMRDTPPKAYDRATFERCLAARFVIGGISELPGGDRILYRLDGPVAPR